MDDERVGPTCYVMEGDGLSAPVERNVTYEEVRRVHAASSADFVFAPLFSDVRVRQADGAYSDCGEAAGRLMEMRIAVLHCFFLQPGVVLGRYQIAEMTGNWYYNSSESALTATVAVLRKAFAAGFLETHRSLGGYSWPRGRSYLWITHRRPMG